MEDRKIVIATHIFREMSEEDKQEIADAFQRFGEVELSEIGYKGYMLETVINFLIRNIPILIIIRDGIIYEALKYGMKKIISVVHKHNPKCEVYFRLESDGVTIVIGENDLDVAFEKLPSTLSKLEMEIKAERHFWISYENGKWNIKEI